MHDHPIALSASIRTMCSIVCSIMIVEVKIIMLIIMLPTQIAQRYITLGTSIAYFNFICMVFKGVSFSCIPGTLIP